MKKMILTILFAALTAVPAAAESPKYDLATFGPFLVVTIDKSFAPQRQLAIHKDTIISVNREDEHIKIVTDVLFRRFDRELETYIDKQHIHLLHAKDKEDGEKLFFRIMEQLSG